jgi:hypothetical protein
MTLGELIAALNALQTNNQMPAAEMNSAPVVVNAPIADMDCWTRKDMIEVVITDGRPVVRIKGDIGA